MEKSKFDEEFIKNYDEDSNKGYILEVDVKYPKDLHNLDIDLPSYQKEWKLKKAISLYAICVISKQYLVHIRALKQALNHGLILKEVHRVIQFNQEARLKPYIEMIIKLRT